MSNKPDWKDAPEGAMFWAAETADHLEAWYKKAGDSWFCLGVDSYNAFKTHWYGLGGNLGRDDLEPRP
jgi:hypothetical protein